MMEADIQVIDAVTNKHITTLLKLKSSTCILDLKKSFESFNPKMYIERQSFRPDPKGKTIGDLEILKNLNLDKGGKIYFKDLGPQIGWTTVFLTEYAGPLFIYFLFYLRPAFIYEKTDDSFQLAAMVALFCWSFHYAKRLYETVYVHNFSHSTMPILNLFKNSTYYWGFAAFIAYYNNHPLYTPPIFGNFQLYIGLTGFAICELGNYSIHVALRDLRPPGSKIRKIPMPTSNLFTKLFNLVSCPNYTYECGSWLFYSILSQSLPALIFTTVGFVQMSLWALGKHKNYRKEFSEYPRQRKAILPFLI